MEEIDLKELLQLLVEKKIQIILITILFIIIGCGYSYLLLKPKYETSTTLLLASNSSSTKHEESNVVSNTTNNTINNKVLNNTIKNTTNNKNIVNNTNASITDTISNNGGITTTDITLNSKLVSTYSVLIKSDKIIRKVISNLNLNITENEIRKNVDVSSVSNTEVIKISVKNYDAELSAQIANEIAKVFTDTVDEFFGIENVHIVDNAETPNKPCNVNHIKDIAIFTFIGLVISAFYIFLLTLIDTRIKSQEEIENRLGLTILATIPVYDAKEERKERRKMK